MTMMVIETYRVEYRLEWKKHNTFSGEFLAEQELMGHVLLRKEQKRYQCKEHAKVF